MGKNAVNFHEVNQTRRKFLLVARGVGAVGAVAVLMGRSAAAEAAAVTVAPEELPAGSGYRETEHIRKYYYCASYW